MQKKKTILFGGTFDPIHIGHTAVAGDAYNKTGASKLIFIPAKRSPLKDNAPIAGDIHRMKMIEIAIANMPGFQVSDYEIEKENPSYTFDTVQHFLQQYDEAIDLYFLIGSDCIAELEHWYRITELIDICNITPMYRDGYDRPDFTKFIESWGSQRVEKITTNIIQTPLLDISSSEIRDMLSKNQDPGAMLDPKVYEYIRENGLYKQP